MKIFSELTQCQQDQPVYLTIGSYDGIHVGHQHIISAMVTTAKENDGCSVVLTFSNHPLTVINPRRGPKLILTSEEKKLRLAKLGVDAVIDLPFTKELAEISGNEFSELIRVHLRPREIFVGPDCTFGKNGEGSPELLRKAGLNVTIFPAVQFDGHAVSSTAIRNMIAQGKMNRVAQMLGRAYTLSGIVVDGLKRGRGLGYPTINVDFSATKVEPALGVYVARVNIAGTLYAGVANFGMSPTIDVNKLRLEVFIFDFAKMIYGEYVEVQLLKMIRTEAVFDSIADLKAQMREDVEHAKRYLQNIQRQQQ